MFKIQTVDIIGFAVVVALLAFHAVDWMVN